MYILTELVIYEMTLKYRNETRISSYLYISALSRRGSRNYCYGGGLYCMARETIDKKTLQELHATGLAVPRILYTVLEPESPPAFTLGAVRIRIIAITLTQPDSISTVSVNLRRRISYTSRFDIL